MGADPGQDRSDHLRRQLLGRHPAGAGGPCVKTVFPLPNGNAIVLLRPESRADGSLVLVSAGRRFGDPGFYFTVHRPDRSVTARYLRSFRERIHVFAADGRGVRADHTMSLWGCQCLHLHYRMRRASDRAQGPPNKPLCSRRRGHFGLPRFIAPVTPPLLSLVVRRYRTPCNQLISL